MYFQIYWISSNIDWFCFWIGDYLLPLFQITLDPSILIGALLKLSDHETHEKASLVDAFEKPAVKEKDLQPDTISQIRQESPDATHISHSSYNKTYVTHISTNASIVSLRPEEILVMRN